MTLTRLAPITIDATAKAGLLAANRAVAREGFTWSPRATAYYNAWSRRLNRERRAAGQHGAASECLMALTGALTEVLANRR